MSSPIEIYDESGAQRIRGSQRPPGGGSQPWGEESTAKFAGSGSPVGVVTPTGEGDLYLDNTTPALWQATGATSADWQQVGAAAIRTEYVSQFTAGIVPAGNRYLDWGHADGEALLDYTDPQNPTVIEAGTYLATITVDSDISALGGQVMMNLGLVSSVIGQNNISQVAPFTDIGGLIAELSSCSIAPMAAGDPLNLIIWPNIAETMTWSLNGYVAKLS